MGLLTEDSTLTMVEEKKCSSLQAQGEEGLQSSKKGLAAITAAGESQALVPVSQSSDQLCKMGVTGPSNGTSFSRFMDGGAEVSDEVVTQDTADGAVGGDYEPMSVDEAGDSSEDLSGMDQHNGREKDKAMIGMAKDFENLLTVQEDLGAASQTFGSEPTTVDVMK